MKKVLSNNLRQQIVQQAVRLLAEGAEVDYLAAKNKAARHLGYSGQKDLPTNQEIESELKKYQAMFYGDTQEKLINEKRREAVAAMTYFSSFEPRLVGSVLEGTATDNSPIEIHLFVDSLEEVTFFLLDKKIPFEISDRQVHLNKNDVQKLPVISFAAGQHDIELTVFPYKNIRQNSISSASGLPLKRASIKKVQELL